MYLESPKKKRQIAVNRLDDASGRLHSSRKKLTQRFFKSIQGNLNQLVILTGFVFTAKDTSHAPIKYRLSAIFQPNSDHHYVGLHSNK